MSDTKIKSSEMEETKKLNENIKKQHECSQKDVCETCGDDLNKKYQPSTPSDVILNRLKLINGSAVMSYVMDDK